MTGPLRVYADPAGHPLCILPADPPLTSTRLDSHDPEAPVHPEIPNTTTKRQGTWLLERCLERAHAGYLVTQRGAHYLITVKGNQADQVPVAHDAR